MRRRSPTSFSDPRVLGRLSDRLSLASEADGLVRERIGDAILVDRLEAALELHRAHPGADFLTSRGEAVLASGLVSAGGHVASDRGLLAHNRHTHEARAERAEADAAASALKVELDSARAEAAAFESEVERLRGELDECDRRRVEILLRAERAAGERERTGRRAGVLQEEMAALGDEEERLTLEMTDVASVVSDCEAAQRTTEEGLSAETGGLDEMDREIRETGDVTAVLRADVAFRKQLCASMERERERLRTASAEIESRLGNVLAEIEEARGRVAEGEAGLAAAAEELARSLVDRERVAAEIAAAEQDIFARRASLHEREGALKNARTGLDRCREASQAAEIALTAAEANRRHLDELCLQELGISATECAAAQPESVEGQEGAEAAVETDGEALDAAIADLRRKIDEIGPVNLTAIDEFSELEQRYTFLTSQQTDLTQSIESLRETIRRINRQSRDRFAEAFEAIRVSFQDVFKSLFNGGRADLWLEEADDILESGVEIMVQPPGKRLGNVHLLSGGEKAMAAIALLFAIFRYQPSPFCLLDEVDAALDDVNVNRFTKMLREYAEQTQFIMITHNKRSMEIADLLYGVTMEEPGVSRLVSLRL